MVAAMVDIADSKQTAFGLKEGRMCAPADVQSGLACGCTCIGCGAILIAKKGVKKRWHFAHHNVEIGESCAESAIHAAAKQVLLEQNWLRLPGMRVVVCGQATSGQTLEESSVLSEERVVRFERTCAEVWEDGIRPDVVGYRGERRLLVEMYFRHRVEGNKRRKIGKLKLPTIEVDLSDLDVSTGFDAIAQRVIHETAYKTWLFFPNEEQERQRLLAGLAARIERANREHRVEQAADQKRQATRHRKLENDRKRREAANQRYRQMLAVSPPRCHAALESSWPLIRRRELSWSSDSVLMPRECAGNSALPAILGGDYWIELLVISVARGFHRELIEFHRFLAGNVYGIAPMTLH